MSRESRADASLRKSRLGFDRDDDVDISDLPIHVLLLPIYHQSWWSGTEFDRSGHGVAARHLRSIAV